MGIKGKIMRHVPWAVSFRATGFDLIVTVLNVRCHHQKYLHEEENNNNDSNRANENRRRETSTHHVQSSRLANRSSSDEWRVPCGDNTNLGSSSFFHLLACGPIRTADSLSCFISASSKLEEQPSYFSIRIGGGAPHKARTYLPAGRSPRRSTPTQAAPARSALGPRATASRTQHAYTHAPSLAPPTTRRGDKAIPNRYQSLIRLGPRGYLFTPGPLLLQDGPEKSQPPDPTTQQSNIPTTRIRFPRYERTKSLIKSWNDTCISPTSPHPRTLTSPYQTIIIISSAKFKSETVLFCFFYNSEMVGPEELKFTGNIVKAYRKNT